MSLKINVGCSGFCTKRAKYFKEFNTVEVQQTFYKIPRESTLMKWKKLAGEDFTFNIKSFQGVTHPPFSPTWKRYGKKIPKGCGLLQPTKCVFESWEKTLKAAEILKSEVILIQLPKSFSESEENWKNAETFFENIERKEFDIAVELRGWSEKGIEKFCKKFDVLDVCDINVRYPKCLGKRKILYTRLHGTYKNGRVIYSYEYSKKELEKILERITTTRATKTWVYFNNSFMYKNAIEFKKLAEEML